MFIITRTHYNLAIANGRLLFLLFNSHIKVNDAAAAAIADRLCQWILLWHARATICWNYKRIPLILNGTWAKCANEIVRFMSQISWIYRAHVRAMCACEPDERKNNKNKIVCLPTISVWSKAVQVYFGWKCSRQFMSCIQRISYAHLNNVCYSKI